MKSSKEIKAEWFCEAKEEAAAWSAYLDAYKAYEEAKAEVDKAYSAWSKTAAAKAALNSNKNGGKK